MSTSTPSNINFTLFKDSLAHRILSLPDFTNTSNVNDDPDDSLDDFISYLASEAWSIIPDRLKTLTAPSTSEQREDVVLTYLDSDNFTQILDSTPTSFIDTLTSLRISSLDSDDDIRDFLHRVTSDYVSTALTPVPLVPWSKTRTAECEICEREMHDKVKKRGWHPLEMLNSVAWLCRPCHSSVHRAATNEELAREYYTVEKLLEREDIQKWRAYAAKQRFGMRRG
ncbi:hypothetical protein BDY19DRAFT_986432 [Irpex rosettiformis]|uniref:Uncharacterized protein n=1 Tax=Irpex rosettiformis TaxID=378272 RepID=A0ACB8TXR8_9APHY|nr:hypothetical protein BDY19DRAFT_986432 [Irpex rosettiformis]